MDNYKLDDIEIFIATHNRADYLQQSIDSLLNQTVGVNEITVLDNESTDNTEAIVSLYKDKGVKYIKTQGFLGNYKKAQELASKEFVMLFHDDDLLHPSYLEMAMDALNKYDEVSLVLTRYTEFVNDSVPTMPENISKCHYLYSKAKDFAAMMFFNEHIAYATAIYRSENFKKLSVDYDKYNKFNDWPYLVEMSKLGKTVLFDDKNLFFVRRHDKQDTFTPANTPSIEQIINWDKCFYEVFINSNDSELIKMYDVRSTHFLKGKYEVFLSPKDRENYSFKDVVKTAQSMGMNIGEKCHSAKDYFKFNLFQKRLQLKHSKKMSFFHKLEFFIFTISHGQISLYKTPKGLYLDLFGRLKTKLISAKN